MSWLRPGDIARLKHPSESFQLPRWPCDEHVYSCGCSTCREAIRVVSDWEAERRMGPGLDHSLCQSDGCPLKWLRANTATQNSTLENE